MLRLFKVSSILKFVVSFIVLPSQDLKDLSLSFVTSQGRGFLDASLFTIQGLNQCIS